MNVVRAGPGKIKINYATDIIDVDSTSGNVRRHLKGLDTATKVEKSTLSLCPQRKLTRQAVPTKIWARPSANFEKLSRRS